jgi:hypothetical protein
MKVLVCGSRKYQKWDVVRDTLDRLLAGESEIHVIQGGAKGADFMGRRWAVIRKQSYTEIKAEWKTHGLAAGPIRNRKMLDLKPDLVVAFHDDPGLGVGTKDCVDEAHRRGIRTEVYLL